MERIFAMIVVMHARVTDRLTDRERGATATEYALLVALIAVVIVGGVTFFGGKLNTFFSTLSGKVGL